MFRTDVVEENNVNLHTYVVQIREKNKEIFRFGTNKGFVKGSENSLS